MTSALFVARRLRSTVIEISKDCAIFVGITVYLCITEADLVAQMCCVYVELLLHVSLDGTAE